MQSLVLDTNSVIKKLEQHGFSRAQATAAFLVRCLALSPPQMVALVAQADTKKLVGDSSTTQPVNRTVASVPSAYRARRRANNFGSWVFGIFGW